MQSEVLEVVDRDCYLGFLDDDGAVWESEGVPVRFLQYEVREGGEAGELVMRPIVFIANRDSSFILQESVDGGELDSGGMEG